MGPAPLTPRAELPPQADSCPCCEAFRHLGTDVIDDHVAGKPAPQARAVGGGTSVLAGCWGLSIRAVFREV